MYRPTRNPRFPGMLEYVEGPTPKQVARTVALAGVALAILVPWVVLVLSLD